MSDALKPSARVPFPPPVRTSNPFGVAVVCGRPCGPANVYRMHAVWRGADCGCKTDCCGW